MVPREGVEPPTLSLGRICSIQLSYRGVCCATRYKLEASSLLYTNTRGGALLESVSE